MVGEPAGAEEPGRTPTPRDTARRVLTGALAVAVTVGVVLTVSSQVVWPGGPLVYESTVAVEFPLEDGQVGTWGTPLPSNHTNAHIVLESVELVNPTGVDVLGVVVRVVEPGTDGVGTAYGFPPEGMTLRDPAGAVIEPGAIHGLDVIVGVRRLNPGSDGTIEALRVRYRHAGARYESVLRAGLRVFDPSAPPS